MSKYYIAHHGILGQKWGKRNGPPYPLSGRQFSSIEKAFQGNRTRREYSKSNKKHFDTTLKKGTELATLSFNKNRMKDTDMFYAAHQNTDKRYYMSFFNYPAKDTETGKVCWKYLLKNKLKDDMKIASEDSCVDAFRDLVKKDRDFSNFVFDKNRMQSTFVDSQYMWSAYREAREALDRSRKDGYQLTDADLRSIYKMYNYTIPSDGKGNKRMAADVVRQREKFFNKLHSMGYGGLIDSNDSINNHVHAKSAVIVFDMSNCIPQEAMNTSIINTITSAPVYLGRRFLGI